MLRASRPIDKHYITGAFDVTGLGYGLRLYGEPRTFIVAGGVEFQTIRVAGLLGRGSIPMVAKTL